ncbi:hypothetical protein HWI79_2487 [Cryptosporidium felis]|nr:hypothetical protein HWI79_2487 [Cryptosporidium felis]
MMDLAPTPQIEEEETIFIDLPELSRLEIFDEMNVHVENWEFDESEERLSFELSVAPQKNPKEESVRFKFHGKSLNTVGTCMFFGRDDNTNESVSTEEVDADKTENREDTSARELEIRDNDQIMQDISEEKSDIYYGRGESDIIKSEKFKLVYVGKCRKVIQAFIVD